MAKKKYVERRRKRRRPWYEQHRAENPVRHSQQWEQIYKRMEAEEWKAAQKIAQYELFIAHAEVRGLTREQAERILRVSPFDPYVLLDILEPAPTMAELIQRLNELEKR